MLWQNIIFVQQIHTQKIYTFDKLNQSIITSESKTETRLSKNFLLFVFIFLDNIFFVLSYWRYVNFPLRSRIKETRIDWVCTNYMYLLHSIITLLFNPQQYWRKEFVKLLKYFVWYKNRENSEFNCQWAQEKIENSNIILRLIHKDDMVNWT